MRQRTLRVKGMSCEHCVKTVKTALESVPGVAQAQVSLSEGTAAVQLTLEQVSSERLIQAVKDAGYEAEEA